MHGTLGIGRISFPTRPARCAIRAIDFKDLDFVVTQDLRQARAVGGGPLNAGTSHISMRSGPSKQLQLASRGCFYGVCRKEFASDADDSAKVFIQMGIDPKNYLVLIHLYVPSKLMMASPTSTAGQDTQGAEQGSY